MAHSSLAAGRPKAILYFAQGIVSIAATLLNIGIFFYMQRVYGWGAARNFQLAAAQGAVYIIGALSAGTLTSKFGRQRWSWMVYVGLAALTALAATVHSASAIVVISIIFSGIISSTWPALESLAISGGDAHAMSRSTAIYNLTWSGTGAVAMAVSGIVMERFGSGYFLVAAVLLLASAGLMILYGTGGEDAGHAHEDPPEALRESRTLALWLARVAMPATYIVIYGLSAAMPELPILRGFDTAHKTLLGSVWLAGRFFVFMFLGATTFWHARPKLLLAATLVMVVAFVGVTVRVSDVLGPKFVQVDLANMVAWQLVLGIVIGVIYAGSLYFGMVLTQGSTETGGYHEALIGLGSVLGPGAGAIAAQIRPGDLGFGIRAVTGLIGLSALATLAVSGAARKRI